ncbi:hypothetical protein [Paenibacillus donghaensis]|uniref:Uncharacterized protein n=1 Tax=Paenibacillus donghaensis TaxID=414771 RepID=A0A2Z2KSL0_9BACL|nr:hypothetical protein [Paenibacillus donghaensis]ASA22168.1 hypothetical protein B9T62_16110 [Paenibacillus donghaensis]
MEDLTDERDFYKERQLEIMQKVALEAERRPLLDSGLWFHDDVRNNFYYASYLFAAAVDEELALPFDRAAAKEKAEAVLKETLLLQNRQPGTKLYGHWPLGLNPLPREAEPHELPVEIMGSLLAYFCKRYNSLFNAGLRVAMNTAMGHIYRSDFFRKPLTTFGHHEAKYTAAKLIFGQMFEDAELREDGKQSLEETLKQIKQSGMPEYGSLPWFWHWVQAFTCAWELETDTEVKSELAAMLDHLWEERADVYLKGAWVGPHSRGWPHDVPADGNPLHDYVQFGDFPLPPAIPRTEYAGFLFYEAPAQVRALALDRKVPTEVTKVTQKIVPGTAAALPLLHTYAYITEEFAAGGMWERVEEFDNEQLRWAYSLPLTGQEGANQLFFFHPGEGWRPGDLRHQSPYSEVLFHRSAVLALYPVPQGDEDTIIGVLPSGTWLQQDRAIYGLAGQAYFAIFLSHDYGLKAREGYTEVTAAGMPGGVVVEALGVKEAMLQGISGLESFAEMMSAKAPRFETVGTLQVAYNSIDGASLQLIASAGDEPQALLDGTPITLEHYTV